jgi:hypothetical protein
MTGAPLRKVVTRPLARQLVSVAGSAAWRLARLGAALGVVGFGIDLAGPWPTAMLTAAVLVVWGLVWWAAWERRFNCRGLSGRPVERTHESGGPEPGEGVGQHVAFARALVAVSARYLALCEDQTETSAWTEMER